jgi:cation diffusion facilitator family transporter
MSTSLQIQNFRHFQKKSLSLRFEIIVMNRNYAAIQQVLILTFLLNLIAALAKLSVGLWTGALSLVADGLDSLFDGISNLIGLIAVRISSQPPDEEHPYGHRKFETLAALFIAAALFVTAWELTTDALSRLFDPPPLEVNWLSIGALLFGGVVQALTGLWELRKGRELASEVLQADAHHTLASIGVSAAVLVGLGLVWLGYPWADAAVTLLVAGAIAKIGVDTVRDNVPALVDRAPLDATQIGAIVAGVEGVESYHRIRSRGPADKVAIDLHVRVASNLSMQEANAIADEVRRRLLGYPGVDDVVVHTEAQRGPDTAPDLYAATRLAAQEVGLSVHEWWVQMTDQELSMHLHVGVDPNLTLAIAHALVDKLERTIQERLPAVKSVHTHMEPANVEVLPSARVSSGLHQRIATAVERAVTDIPHLRNPHDLQVRQVEGKLFITVEVLIDGRLPMSEAHELSTRLQEAIRATIPNVGEALVHLEPQVEY